VSISHAMVVVGAGRAPSPCLLGVGRSESPPLPEAVGNSLVEFPIMACNGDGDPLGFEPMKVAYDPPPPPPERGSGRRSSQR
jgi:hypothetical protein